jgi:hypothetical protein
MTNSGSGIEIWDVIDLSDDRQGPVAFLTLEIDQAEHEGKREVTLPLDVAKVVLACAEDGMRKGQGRKGGRGGSPKQKYERALAVREMIEWARRRKAELVASTDYSAIDAEIQSADEARERYASLLLSQDYIRRLMQDATIIGAPQVSSNEVEEFLRRTSPLNRASVLRTLKEMARQQRS